MNLTFIQFLTSTVTQIIMLKKKELILPHCFGPSLFLDLLVARRYE